MVRRRAAQSGLSQTRWAFTLIELLVVIAIIGVLVGLVFPAFGKARRAAQGAVSMSNLGQCGKMQIAYSLDYKGGFVNPFDARNPVTWGLPWFDIIAQESLNGGPLLGHNFNDPEYCTELFANFWASSAHQYITTTGTTASKALVSPNDTIALLRYQAQVQQASATFSEYFWTSSYWSPPTLWLSTAPFKTAARVTVSGNDSRYWRRNRFDDVIDPQAKVMVFERFDFTKTTRAHRAGGREDYFPTFNNPEATTRFATVDGSVSGIKVAKLDKLTSAANPNQAERDLYTPAGFWDVPDATLGDPDVFANAAVRKYGLGRDAMENGDGTMLGVPGGFYLFRAYFWGTRNGIQGRDIPR